MSDVWLVRTTDVDSKATITANLAICHSDTSYETNYTLIHKLIRYSDSFPPGWCVEVVCLRRLSSLKQLTRNRLKPVQTGRFHLGLVFSRWRRVKFGLGLRPHRFLIGRGFDGDFLVGADWLIGLSFYFNSLKRPRDYSARREKEGRLPCRMDSYMTPLISISNK